MSDPWSVGGASALQEHAPTAAAAMSGLIGLWPESLSQTQLSTIRTVTAEGIGLTPLRRPPSGPQRESEDPSPELMAFAEQFAVDVSVIDHDTRAGFLRTVGGSAAFEAALSIYVADYVPRVRRALDGLFGHEAWYDVGLTPSTLGQHLMDSFINEVAVLDGLDAVTRELVRLRGARQHHCRVCMSRRSLAALSGGADARMFEEIDHYRNSGLSETHQAALALVDAMIWTPADPRSGDVAAARAMLSPAQAVEVVLDVMRNAANKIGVALAADATEHEGVQLFEVDGTGRLSFP